MMGRSVPLLLLPLPLLLVVVLVTWLPLRLATSSPPVGEDGATLALGGDVAVPEYEVLRAHVVGEYPLPPNQFVQGFTVLPGQSERASVSPHMRLVYGTGLWGQSHVRVAQLSDGTVLHEEPAPLSAFGEGIAFIDEHLLVQLTYHQRKGLFYNVTDSGVHYIGAQPYPAGGPAEGWGVTSDGSRLYVSDGSATLFIFDLRFSALVGRLTVRGVNGEPVVGLNELEFVRGSIYANVYRSDCLVRISPRTGRVQAYIVASLFPDNPYPSVDVLNGIAYDPLSRRLFLTGKMWKRIFEVSVKPAPDLQGSLRQCRRHEMSLNDYGETSRLLQGVTPPSGG